jgi:hypothetical protein
MAEQDDRLARLEVWLGEFDKRQQDRFAALNTRIDDLRHDIDARFAALNQRIDDVVHRLDGLDTRLLAIEGRLTMIEQGKADKWAVNLWGTTVIGWTSLLVGAAVALIKLWP